MSCRCAKNRFTSGARTRITLQMPSATDDGYGGRTDAFTDLSTVWAVVEPMAGRENYISGQLQSRVDARVTIRYQAALADTIQTAKLRIKYGARLYNVHHVLNVADDMKTEGRAYQRLLCTEGEPS
ncbi:phage head closure protein [Methylorubrum sp. SB2]|uniref:phage head closure protein n=1 Tax=Methylorubrum subtropicum TaxID=3138812 RepID=UPI00313B0837